MAHIYRIFNVVTEHFYIGSALNYKRRRWEHWDLLKKNSHHCQKLQAAWNEFGADAFEFELLEEVNDADALRIEDMYLVQHAGSAVCYNTAHTTMQPPSVSAEARDKISASLKALYADPSNHPRVGKVHTEETKRRISAAKKANPTRFWQNKERSEETREKISISQKGKPKGPRTYTEEGLAKARENMRRNAREQTPLGLDAVMGKFPAEVLSRYDFSGAIYKGALVRIEGCKCPIHGVFSQYAAQFRKGRGCPECGGVQRASAKRAQMLGAWATEEGRRLFIDSRKKSVDTPPTTC